MFHQMAGLSIQSPLTISVLVVHLLLMPFVGGQSQLIVPSQPIEATVGDDIILLCHLEPAEDVTSYTVEWSRSDLEPRYVHVWRVGQELIKIKNPLYSGRTSLFTDELKHGNISLKLSRVKPGDEGRYTCFIPDNKKESFVKLRVGAASSAVLSLAGTDKDKGGVVLQCESKGWYPEPELLWLDAEGKLLSAGPTETVRGPDVLYTVSSRVTVEKRHSNSFTCRVQQKTINQTRDTHIHVPDDFFKLQSTSSPVITGLAVTMAVSIIIIISLVFFVLKLKQNIKPTMNQRDESGGGEKVTERLMTEEKVETEDEKKSPTKGKLKKKKTEEAEREVETLRSELETKNKEIREKQTELMKFSEDKQRMEDELKEKLEELKELKELKKKLNIKNTELQEIRNTTSWSLLHPLGPTKEELKKKKEEAEQEVETLEEELETKETELQTKIKQLPEKQSELLQLVLDQFQTTKYKQEELHQLQEEKKKLEDELQRQKTELETKNQQLEKQLQEEKKKREEVETMKKKKNQQEKITEMEYHQRDLYRDIGDLKEDGVKLQRLQSQLETKNQQLEKQLQEEKKKRKEEVETMKKKIREMEKQLEDLERLRKELETKNQQLEKQFQEEKKKQEDEHQRQKKELETKNQQLETNQAETNKKKEEAEREVEKMKKEVEELKQKQDDLQQLQKEKKKREDEHQRQKKELETKNQQTSSQRRQDQPDKDYAIMINQHDNVVLKNNSSERLKLKNWTLHLEFTKKSQTITLGDIHSCRPGKTEIIWNKHKDNKKPSETGELVNATLLTPSGETVATCTRQLVF